MTSPKVILSAQGIHKQFPGVLALNDVFFDLREGELHALMGENGAGKSTLIKIISGLYSTDEGSITVGGKVVSIKSPFDARINGIATVYQELSLVESLTVAENIFMGRLPRDSTGLFVNWKKLMADTQDLLTEAGIELDPGQIVSSMSVGFRQQVEIARALSMNARVVIFDEPTAVLTNEESSVLFKNIEKLKNRGVGIIYISHRMEEIFELSDRITVLRDGKLIKTLERGEAGHDDVIKLMVGREIDKYAYKRDSCVHDEPALRVEDIVSIPKVRGVSFSLCKGEILGVYGLVGAGRTELARAIFGLDKKDGGSVFLGSRKVEFRSPRDAISAGIGFLPEDRRRQGLILENSVLVNNNLANHRSVSRFGFFKSTADIRQVQDGISMLDIKTSNIQEKVVKLSGGNQQKIILSRWLTRKPNPGILILDEPTRGVDVGAKNEIHRLIRLCAENGMAVLMISSDMHEVLTVSDRIIVMREGLVVGEMIHDEATEESVVGFAAG